ncbi:MAG: hypothetical protein ACK5XN_19965, partial [Bacteroidota bacterium]
GSYDAAYPLIIDPSLVFSSFSRSTSDNWGFSATPGPDGSMFGAGICAVTGFPVTLGAYQTQGGGPGSSDLPPDIVIIKLSPDGRTRLYATYLGGSGIEQPHSLIADADGNLVVAGRTNSGSSFPGTLFGPGGAYDIFITKFNATGTSLIGSVKIGGSQNDGVNMSESRSTGPRALLRNYGDDGRSEVILDKDQNILLASCTWSNNFFVRNAFQSGFAGGLQDGVIIKLNPNATSVVWSTYLGGSGDDAAFVLSTQPGSGEIYVAGGTTSTNFPGMNPGVVQSTYNGGPADGFITRLNGSGNAVSLLQGTYLGTDQIDIVYGVQFDQQGFPYVMGTSTGNWPVTSNVGYRDINARQFISKLQPDLSGFVYSTTFGTPNALAPNISPVAFLVDNCENVYV